MIIEKAVKKDTAISSKITEAQEKKLVALAKDRNMTKSAIIAKLLEIGYIEVTKRKTF